MNDHFDLSNDTADAKMYMALSGDVDMDRGHEVPLDLYPPAPKEFIHGVVSVYTGYNGLLPNDEFDGDIKNTTISEGNYKIHYMMTEPQTIDRIWFVFLHGVPTNARQYVPIMHRLGRFFPCMAFDMLGMGESSKPRCYGESYTILSSIKETGDLSRATGAHQTAWQWQNDIEYIKQTIKQVLGDTTRYVFVADDWGGGQLAHFITSDNVDSNMIGACFIDPIAFDGYPVSEIQAIGRASMIPNDTQFAQAMGAFDQTLVQIYKTMVHNPHQVYNQYSLREFKFPYIDANYITTSNGEKATSTTMRLKMSNIRVLAERASVLSSQLLLPHHPQDNPLGPKYSQATVPVLVLWGEYDNMMPENQRYRYKLVLNNARGFQHQRVPRAGHFAGTDNPNYVSAALINWFDEYFSGYDQHAPFMGFDGIFKGDEKHIFETLK
jgi:pimeloyl-ACP methyl ester carboxylesterase